MWTMSMCRYNPGVFGAAYNRLLICESSIVIIFIIECSSFFFLLHSSPLCLLFSLLSSLVSRTFRSLALPTSCCSASMLPGQRSYRQSELPRPREKSSFPRRWRDTEEERSGVLEVSITLSIQHVQFISIRVTAV